MASFSFYRFAATAMCLGIPLRILAVESPERGLVDLDGAATPVDLSLIENPRPGDYVIVHAGFAIERLDTAEADARIAMFRALAAAAPTDADASERRNIE